MIYLNLKKKKSFGHDPGLKDSFETQHHWKQKSLSTFQHCCKSVVVDWYPDSRCAASLSSMCYHPTGLPAAWEIQSTLCHVSTVEIFLRMQKFPVDFLVHLWISSIVWICLLLISLLEQGECPHPLSHQVHWQSMKIPLFQSINLPFQWWRWWEEATSYRSSCYFGLCWENDCYSDWKLWWQMVRKFQSKFDNKFCSNGFLNAYFVFPGHSGCLQDSVLLFQLDLNTMNMLRR